MQVDHITEPALKEALSWWPARDQGDMPANVLPPLGFMVSKSSQNLAAAWVYVPEGCRLFIVDWLVARPGLSMASARQACRALFEKIQVEASQRGITRIFASVSSPAMIREAAALGFTVCSQSTHLAKSL